MHEERRGEQVAQIAEARHDAREAIGLGDDIEELDLQQIAGLRAFDVDRAGERMDAARRELRDVRRRRGPRKEAIEPVTGFEPDLLALGHLDDRRNVRVPTVVPGPGFVDQLPAAIDLDGYHGLPRCSYELSVRRCNPTASDTAPAHRHSRGAG